MPTTLIINSLAAIAAAAGVAAASFTGTFEQAYGDENLQRLTRAELSQNAWAEFSRADQNRDHVLDADEFAALSIVKAELAHLNGFVSVVIDDKVHKIDLPIAAPASLAQGERTRIEAVARHTFYAFAGTDGEIAADDYIAMQEAMFAIADVNRNKTLAKKELTYYGARQAYLLTGA